MPTVEVLAARNRGRIHDSLRSRRLQGFTSWRVVLDEGSLLNTTRAFETVASKALARLDEESATASWFSRRYVVTK